MVQVHPGPRPEPAGSGGFFDPWGRRHRGTATFQSTGHPSARLRVRLGSRGDHVPLVLAREPGRCEVLHGVRDPSIGARPRRRGGTESRHGPVLRSRRVHRDLGGRRPRGRGPDALGLRRDGAGPDRGPRRRRGEVHRRRRRRGLRGARRARGRPGASRARRHSGSARTPSASRRSAEPRSVCASGSTPGRPWCASVSPRARVNACSPGMRSTPPHGSNRWPPRWGWPSVSPPTRPPRRSSTTRSWSPRRSRANPSRCGSSTRRTRSPGSAPTSPGPTTRPSSAARSTWRC